jgi:ABC-2 type transport system ATP-binding protein
MFGIHTKTTGGPMDSLIVSDVRKEYPSFTLDSVSFRIPKGYIMGFVGENGAGKTTTIKSILNIISRDGGSVTIFGKDLDEHELEIKHDIGYVSGETFYPKKKLKDITRVYRRFFSHWDHEVYREYMGKFNLDEDKRLDQLSKGMGMKYSIALALSHHARLLILDEPTSGLDPVARDTLLEVFQSLVAEAEVSILYSTHITSDLEKCADYITFIQNGRIIESAQKDDLMDNYRLVNGSQDDLARIEDRLIAYKTNAFGFTGLVKSADIHAGEGISTGKPSIDDIIIFFAERGNII